MTENLHDVTNERVISCEGGKLAVEFKIPASSDFFDGHFPSYKLLPAVGQFELVTRFSEKYLHTKRCIQRIKRMKFTAMIRPETELLLEVTLHPEKNTASFVLSDAKTKALYSSGSFEAAEKSA